MAGAPPDHEVSVTQVRFRKPDGSWGDWIQIEDSREVEGNGGGGGGAATDETYALYWMS